MRRQPTAAHGDPSTTFSTEKPSRMHYWNVSRFLFTGMAQHELVVDFSAAKHKCGLVVKSMYDTEDPQR